MASRMTGVAVLAAAVATLGLVAESSSAGREQAAESRKFVSKRYGYEIVLQGRWKPTYARKTWSGGFPLMDSGEVDFFEDSRERFFIVAATRVPAGTTLRKWERTHAGVMTESLYCEKSRAFRSTRLGGAAAREFQSKCLVHDAIVGVAVRRGRGYTFQFVSPKENSSASDRRIFDAGRRGFRFTSR